MGRHSNYQAAIAEIFLEYIDLAEFWQSKTENIFSAGEPSATARGESQVPLFFENDQILTWREIAFVGKGRTIAKWMFQVHD